MIWTSLTVVGSVVAVIGIAVAVMWVAGSRAPAQHVAARRMRFRTPPAELFAWVADPRNAPSWRSDLKTVEVLSQEPLRFREEGKFGPVTFEVEEHAPPSRLVVRIADEGSPFGGRWLYRFEPDGESTMLTITERGIVRPPVFRFLSRYVLGHTATLDRVLRDLARRYGDVNGRPEAGTPD